MPLMNSISGSCDFEHGICGLLQSVYDDFDFTRQSGQTASRGTGPSTDHTTGTADGHYIYIESSYPQRSGDKAEIMTPIYRGSAPKCRMAFAYHMYGSTIGKLEVSCDILILH